MFIHSLSNISRPSLCVPHLVGIVDLPNVPPLESEWSVDVEPQNARRLLKRSCKEAGQIVQLIASRRFLVLHRLNRTNWLKCS